MFKVVLDDGFDQDMIQECDTREQAEHVLAAHLDQIGEAIQWWGSDTLTSNTLRLSRVEEVRS
jgi:hypothetical protein